MFIEKNMISSEIGLTEIDRRDWIWQVGFGPSFFDQHNKIEPLQTREIIVKEG